MFFGNSKAKKQAEAYAKAIQKGKNLNIMIVGPSGGGKTTLALYIAEKSGCYHNLILGNEELKVDRRILIVDEAHRVGVPETLYPVMDGGNITVIILTTEVGVLPEPLINRCIVIYLEPYTEQELLEIAKKENFYGYPVSVLKEVVLRSKGIPRGVKRIMQQLNAYKLGGNNIVEIQKLLDSFGIFEDGLTYEDVRYLHFLKENQPCSLNTLMKALGLPKETIERYIEPYLIRKGYIKVTLKGRVLGY